MSGDIVVPCGSLSERIDRTLRRVEYRRATDLSDLEEIYELRYRAYLREGTIRPDPSGQFTDPIDNAHNTFVVGTYVDGELASSIRLNVTLGDHLHLPTADVFPEILLPKIAAGTIIVDPTRFVADYRVSRQIPELPFITLRIPWLAMEYFKADLMLAAVRPEHQAFYARLWGNRTLCPARPYPHLSKPISLTVLDYRSAKENVHRRHPYFRSAASEREFIFGMRAPRAFPCKPAGVAADIRASSALQEA